MIHGLIILPSLLCYSHYCLKNIDFVAEYSHFYEEAKLSVAMEMQVINRAFKSYMISPIGIQHSQQDSTQQIEEFARKMMRESFFLTPNFTTSPLLGPKVTCRRYKKYIISKKSSNTTSMLVYKNQPIKISSSSFSKSTKLILLGDWIRFAACSLKLQKSYYNRAVILLKKVSKEKLSTYPLAAAALVLIIKFEHANRLKLIEQLPLGTISPNHPNIPIREAYENQLQVLQATNFTIPNDQLAQIILQVCERWNLYLLRNSKHMQIPLKYLLTGFENQWQRRNIYTIAYLVDIITVSSEIFHNSEEIGSQVPSIMIITSAILLTGATNSCTLDKINSRKFALLCFIRSFLKKCYKFSQQYLLAFENLLKSCVKEKVWQKLRYLPTKIQQFETAQHLIKKLEYIPMHNYDEE